VFFALYGNDRQRKEERLKGKGKSKPEVFFLIPARLGFWDIFSGIFAARARLPQ